ncbi:MAG: 16S rRNA (guanine(966)-N(2))-methyltransferase RsmD [Betaproteobacteria bacterium]|nr:16S rRNA (guanine(966)-N(2))-methyltransferase RsmD [Betaproteobacteria bacterium]
MPSQSKTVIRPKAAGHRNQVRLIGGEWRRRIISFPDLPGLRPTPDRVRETLFNWLGQTLTGRHCLDLFAGSGALGFEAASRGATRVVMIETERQAIASLRANQQKLSASACHIIAGDATRLVAAMPDTFDVIFVDPPFHSGLLPVLLPLLHRHLKPAGVIYAEWGQPINEVLVQHGLANTLQTIKTGKAGVAHFGLLSALSPLLEEVSK